MVSLSTGSEALTAAGNGSLTDELLIFENNTERLGDQYYDTFLSGVGCCFSLGP